MHFPETVGSLEKSETGSQIKKSAWKFLKDRIFRLIFENFSAGML